VDPLAEKYPNISSYVYCADNPVNVVDPDGRLIVFVVTKGDNMTYYQYNKGNFWLMKENGKGGYYKTDVRYNPGKESTSKSMYRLLKLYRKIENSGNKDLKGILNYLSNSKHVNYVSENNEKLNEVKLLPNNESQTTLDFNNIETDKDFKNIGITDLIKVTHEMRHQYDSDIDNFHDDTDENNQDNPVEIRAVYLENRARNIEKLKQRTKYGHKIDQKKLKSPPNNIMPK